MYKTLFKKYPLLLERLSVLIENEYAFVRWITDCLVNDAALLKSRFSIDVFSLAGVSFAGDCHNGGRRTVLLSDRRGNKAVLKPVPLDNALLYSAVIEQLNRLLGTHVHVPGLIVKENYGYVEYIQHKPCTTHQEVRTYYYHCGVVLLAVYLLNGNDIHNENLIAYGSSPVIVDFETLGGVIEHSDHAAFIDKLLKRSVMNSRMLPVKFSSKNDAVRDFSAMGRLMKKVERKVVLEREFRSDPVEQTQEIIEDDTNWHLPEFQGQVVEYDAYLPDILAGFSDAYLAVLKDRHRFLSGLRRQTPASWTYRKVHRSTVVYRYLSARLNVPDMLRDKAYTTQYLYGILAKNPLFEQKDHILQKEADDLIHSDVPYFSVRTGWVDGHEGIGVREKIGQLSYGDFLLQRKLMHISFSEKGDQMERIQATLAQHNQHNRFPRTPVIHFDSVRKQLFRTIVNCVFVSEQGEVDFIALKKNWKGQLEINNLNDGLYDGLLGILLAMNGEDAKQGFFARQLEQNALKRIVFRNGKDSSLVNGTGALVTYYLAAGQQATFDVRLLLKLLMDIRRKVEKDTYVDQEFDLLGGTAGLLLAITQLYRQHGKYKVLKKIALSLGDYLAENRTNREGTVYWPSKNTRNVADVLKGFAHGLSGYLLVFYRLKHLFSTDRYDQIIQEVLKTEQRVMDREHRTTSWCKGYVGLGISRMKMLELEEQPDVWAELETCKREVLDGLFRHNDYSLCHGLIGSLDFLLELNRKGWLDTREKKLLDDVINRFFQSFELDHFHPYKISLFTGLSGILYLIQRLEDEQKPCVLSLHT